MIREWHTKKVLLPHKKFFSCFGSTFFLFSKNWGSGTQKTLNLRTQKNTQQLIFLFMNVYINIKDNLVDFFLRRNSAQFLSVSVSALNNELKHSFILSLIPEICLIFSLISKRVHLDNSARKKVKLNNNINSIILRSIY